MKLNYFITILAITLLWSCSSDEPVSRLSESTETAFDKRFLSPEEAYQSAIQRLDELGISNISSRSIDDADIEIYHSQSSRGSLQSDSLFYVINFVNGGFSIVTAPRVLNGEIVGFSETGYFDNSNENLVFYMDHLSETYGTLPFKPGDDLPIGSIDPITGEPIQNPETSFVERYDKFVPTMWDQGDPYNFFCPPLTTEQKAICTPHDLYYLGDNCAAGCVPVAIGQIGAFYQKPTTINGYNLVWPSMLKSEKIDFLDSFGQDQVATLLRELGRYTNVKYGITTYTTFPSAYDGCIKAGFFAVRSTSVLNLCFENIKTNGPILVFGYNRTNIGHCWVADGYQKVTYKKWVESKNEYEISRTKHLFHFNWGFGGMSNGYFDVGKPFEIIGDTYSEKNLNFIINFK